MSEFLLADSIGMIDLVSENQEGNLVKVLHGEKGVEFGFGFGEAVMVFCVNEEDDARHFGKVVFPETTGFWGLLVIEARW